MAFGVSYKLPADSILRRGTLIVGVPRQEPPSEQDDSMCSGVSALEASLQKSIAKANGGKVPPPQSASTTRKPNENA